MDNQFFIGALKEAPKASLRHFEKFLTGKEPTTTILHIASNASVEVPIVHLKESSTHLCVLVEKGANVNATMWLSEKMEEHSVEIVLEEDVQCSLVHVNNVSSDSSVAINQRTTIGEKSSLQLSNVTLGGSAVTHDIVSHVIGAEAKSTIDWMFYAKGSEKQKLSARNIFDAKDGGGEILMRGIAEQKGHTICNGMIEIGLKGGGTNTYLTQEVLMLDSTAKVDAIPALEIKTNDVKASHSATVARITEEDLFYFGARGISPEAARRMFILGFLGSITERIKREDVREKVLGEIERKYEI